MNQSLNGKQNGNGNGTNGLLPAAKKNAAASPSISKAGSRENLASFRAADGSELRGQPAKITRHSLVIELFSPAIIPRFSEVLEDLKLTLQGRLVYSGRAVVRNVVDTGTRVVCEVTLNETHWTEVDRDLSSQPDGQIGEEFKAFLHDWQKLYKVMPEFKVAIADMQTFLHNSKLWLDQLEVSIKKSASAKYVELEEQVAKQVGELFVPAFDKLHEALEAVSEKISEDQRPLHQAFAERQLHSLVLCSPFANRAYTKPLGYAGDYEMVNMIGLNPFRGNSLYAKVLNLWFLSQWPSKAHRNRLIYLKEQLQKESWRMARSKRGTRIYNFACGPALELQEFLSNSPLADEMDITLADFNEETLKHTGRALEFIKERRGLNTRIHLERKTVHHIIKAGQSGKASGKEYDVIYCAGLFDYLSDHTCRQMMEVFYDWLAPGGVLMVTNVDDYKPFRHMLEFVLDWHLIYRDAAGVLSLAPRKVPKEEKRAIKDETGVNIFVEVRRPDHV